MCTSWACRLLSCVGRNTGSCACDIAASDCPCDGSCANTGGCDGCDGCDYLGSDCDGSCDGGCDDNNVCNTSCECDVPCKSGGSREPRPHELGTDVKGGGTGICDSTYRCHTSCEKDDRCGCDGQTACDDTAPLRTNKGALNHRHGGVRLPGCALAKQHPHVHRGLT